MAERFGFDPELMPSAGGARSRIHEVGAADDAGTYDDATGGGRLRRIAR